MSNSFTSSGAKASMMAFITAGKVPASPAPFTPKGFNFVYGVAADFHRAHVVRARHAVVHERTGEQLPRLRILLDALEQHLRQALHDTTVDLALQGKRVDLDFSHVAAVREAMILG